MNKIKLTFLIMFLAYTSYGQMIITEESERRIQENVKQQMIDYVQNFKMLGDISIDEEEKGYIRDHLITTKFESKEVIVYNNLDPSKKTPEDITIGEYLQNMASWYPTTGVGAIINILSISKVYFNEVENSYFIKVEALVNLTGTNTLNERLNESGTVDFYFSLKSQNNVLKDPTIYGISKHSEKDFKLAVMKNGKITVSSRGFKEVGVAKDNDAATTQSGKKIGNNEVANLDFTDILEKKKAEKQALADARTIIEQEMFQSPSKQGVETLKVLKTEVEKNLEILKNLKYEKPDFKLIKKLSGGLEEINEALAKLNESYAEVVAAKKLIEEMKAMSVEDMYEMDKRSYDSRISEQISNLDGKAAINEIKNLRLLRNEMDNTFGKQAAARTVLKQYTNIRSDYTSRRQYRNYLARTEVIVRDLSKTSLMRSPQRTINDLNSLAGRLRESEKQAVRRPIIFLKASYGAGFLVSDNFSLGNIGNKDKDSTSVHFAEINLAYRINRKSNYSGIKELKSGKRILRKGLLIGGYYRQGVTGNQSIKALLNPDQLATLPLDTIGLSTFRELEVGIAFWECWRFSFGTGSQQVTFKNELLGDQVRTFDYGTFTTGVSFRLARFIDWDFMITWLSNENFSKTFMRPDTRLGLVLKI